MQKKFTSLEGFTGVLTFLHMMSIFAMAVVIGVAVSTIEFRELVDSSSAKIDAIGLSAAESKSLNNVLLRPIESHLETVLWFWQIGLAISGVAMIMFVFWAFMAHRNLSVFRVRGVKHNSAVSILYWFIPILNMILPHMLLREIWQGSNPAGFTMRRKTRVPSPKLIGLHWICFILGFSWYPTVVFLTMLADQVGFDGLGWFQSQLSGGGWRGIYTWAVISGVALVFMNFVGVYLVMQVNLMQSDRNQIFLSRTTQLVEH